MSWDTSSMDLMWADLWIKVLAGDKKAPSLLEMCAMNVFHTVLPFLFHSTYGQWKVLCVNLSFLPCWYFYLILLVPYSNRSEMNATCIFILTTLMRSVWCRLKCLEDIAVSMMVLSFVTGGTGWWRDSKWSSILKYWSDFYRLCNHPCVTTCE